MFLNPANQLIQIDTGAALTYLFNPSLSAISVYAQIGENQILGQKFYSSNSVTPASPYGSPAVYMLVKYSSIAQPAPVAFPAPVYWTDITFTTVSGVATEAIGGLAQPQFPAGYLMPNTTSKPGLTAAMLQGAQVMIQVGGYLPGALTLAATAIGDLIIPAAGNFTPGRLAAGTAPTTAPFGRAVSNVLGNLTANLLLNCAIY